jgi:hypothetical protein
MPVLLTGIGGRNISTTASSLVSDLGTGGVTAMGGCITDSVGTTAGMAASGAIAAGATVNSLVDGVMTEPAGNGMNMAMAGGISPLAIVDHGDMVAN